MIDISKEAVERLANRLENPEFALRPTLTDGRKGADMLRALSARVAELEQQVRDTLKISNLKREQGRLQGLDEAIAKGNEAYRDIYAEIDHAGPVAQLAVQRATGATQVLRSIKALKEQSND